MLLLCFLPLQRLVCKEPATLHGQEWKDINRDEFVCSSKDEISTQDSVITSTEHVPIDTQQPASNQDWIAYPVLGLIIGFVFVLRCALLKWSRNRHVLSLSFPSRGSSRRSSTRNMDSGIPMSISQSSAASEDSDSASNTADVDEVQTSIHHCEISEVTTN